jgi:hypothetical protein
MAQARSPGFFEKLARKFLLPEESAVQEFVKQSAAFKEMKALAVNAKSNSSTNGVPDAPQEQRVVADIEKASTFADILNATDGLYTLPKGGSFLLWLGSFASDDLKFAHYEHELRNAAVNKMVELGYSAQPEKPSVSH